jgi:hypothetical protein
MAMTAPKRPKITGITLNLLMPDGSTRIRTLDPVQSDGLFWSDRSIDVLAAFYAPGGPAEGKRMKAEDLITLFGKGVTKLLDGRGEVVLTPDLIRALWNHTKEDGTAPAFLCKSIYNPTNG